VKVEVKVKFLGIGDLPRGQHQFNLRLSPDFQRAVGEIEALTGYPLTRNIDRRVSVLVNGRHYRRALGPEGKLADGDLVAVVPLLGGGTMKGRMTDTMFKPEGVYVAMLTPFDDQGRVEEKVLRDMVEWLVEKGVDGLFPVSTVGEFVHLSFEERVRVLEIVVDQAGGRVAVTGGAGDTCAENSIRLTREAQRIGCDAAVVLPPYYYPLSQELVEKHFEAVADAVPDFPIILYNIPLFTTAISYDVVKRLSRRPNVVGMKDSSGSMVDMVHFMDKVRIIGEDFNIMAGREDMFLPALVVGATGTMSATSGIVPEIMTGIYQAYQAGDLKKARELQFSILLLVRAMLALPFPLGFKVAAELRGFPMGPPKQPLSHAEQYNYQGVRARIEKILPRVLEGVGVKEAV